MTLAIYVDWYQNHSDLHRKGILRKLIPVKIYPEKVLFWWYERPWRKSLNRTIPATLWLYYYCRSGKGPIKSAAEGGDDDDYEKKAIQDIALYRVSDASGQLEIEKTNSPPLKKEHLDTNDCFILDAGIEGHSRRIVIAKNIFRQSWTVLGIINPAICSLCRFWV